MHATDTAGKEIHRLAPGPPPQCKKGSFSLQRIIFEGIGLPRRRIPSHLPIQGFPAHIVEPDPDPCGPVDRLPPMIGKISRDPPMVMLANQNEVDLPAPEGSTSNTPFPPPKCGTFYPILFGGGYFSPTTDSTTGAPLARSPGPGRRNCSAVIVSSMFSLPLAFYHKKYGIKKPIEKLFRLPMGQTRTGRSHIHFYCTPFIAKKEEKQRGGPGEKRKRTGPDPCRAEKVSTENGWDPYGNGWPDASVNQYGYDQGYWQPPGASPQPTPYGGWQTACLPVSPALKPISPHPRGS